MFALYKLQYNSMKTGLKTYMTRENSQYMSVPHYWIIISYETLNWNYLRHLFCNLLYEYENHTNHFNDVISLCMYVGTDKPATWQWIVYDMQSPIVIRCKCIVGETRSV